MNENIFVILANLGGPNKRGMVRPFLFNLFKDKYIIPLPTLFRIPLAFLISTLRSNKSQKEYDKMGGFSPILQNTQNQAQLLQEALGVEYKVLVAMSYSSPTMEDAISQIPPNAKKVILLPLYPQFSITTTKSSCAKFCKVATKNQIQNIDVIPHFFANKLYVESCSIRIVEAYNNLHNKNLKTVLLFSAHGIPKDFITKFKDPYQSQIQETANFILQNLEKKPVTIHQSMVCFQSRVGPKEWLKPYIQDTIPQFANCNVIVFPIAFVSEHLETLVELDHQYKEYATKHKITQYERAQTPSNCPLFIEALKEEVLKRV